MDTTIEDRNGTFCFLLHLGKSGYLQKHIEVTALDPDGVCEQVLGQKRHQLPENTLGVEGHHAGVDRGPCN